LRPALLTPTRAVDQVDFSAKQERVEDSPSPDVFLLAHARIKFDNCPMNTRDSHTPVTDPAVVALEKLTVRRYLLGMVFQGVWAAGYVLLPFVLGKSLAAPGWLVTLAVTLETTGMLLALYWGQLMISGGRRRWLFWGGLAGRVIMISTILVSTAGQFALLVGLVYMFAALVYPAQNGILQSNIRSHRRGQVFGWGALVQNLTMAVTSILVGGLLDGYPGSFRLIYPVLGCLGFFYPLILSRLPRPADDLSHDPPGIFTVPRLPLGPVRWQRLAGALITPFREAAATFRADREFLWFEANFMIYGIAFMMLVPVVPLFFINELNLSYKEISSARILIASLGVALLSPLVGRLMDKLNPVRLSSISFVVISLYPMTLALGAWLLPAQPALGAYLAFGIYSVGMAGINMTWNMGSIAFAPPGMGGYYQGIHVAMVGIRGLIGPAIGFTVLHLLGYREVFILAALIFLTAAGSSVQLGRRQASDKTREV
jgi:MFS family permease